MCIGDLSAAAAPTPAAKAKPTEEEGELFPMPIDPCDEAFFVGLVAARLAALTIRFFLAAFESEPFGDSPLVLTSCALRLGSRTEQVLR